MRFCGYQPTCSAPTIILVVDGEGTITVEGNDVLLPLHVGCAYYLNPQTTFTVIGRSGGGEHALHVVLTGMNENLMPTDASPQCAIM